MTTLKTYAGQLTSLVDEYRKKGQSEAAEHRPAGTATHPDQHEVALRTETERWLSAEQQLFNAHLTEASRALVEVRRKNIELDARSSQLVGDRSLISTVEADLAGDSRALTEATEARLRAEVDWKAFRAQNHITEQAKYPESHLWHFGVVAALALIETVINAFFFENAQGLLGGFTVALGVSAVNMGGAMALGTGFRYKNLAAIDKKLLGWLCLVLFLALSLYCNALFATFRAEYQLLQDPTAPAQLREAFAASAAEAKRIFVLDMQIADLMSFILFGVGLLLSGLAFWKGYTFDDRYPGHGPKDRALKDARRYELDQQNDVRRKLQDFLLRRRADVHAAVNEPMQLVSRAASARAALAGAQGVLRTQAEAIQRDYRAVLDAYRKANLAVRATQPPAYFATVDDLTSHVAGDAAQPVLAELDLAQREVDEVRERHQEILSAKLAELHEDAATVLNQTFSEYLRSIEKEAQENIDRMMPTIGRTG